MAKYIRYIGTSHVREISRDDWETAGVNNQDTLRWEKRNSWTIPLSKVSDEAWPFIDADSELVLIESGKPADEENQFEAAHTANDAGLVTKPRDDEEVIQTPASTD